MRRTFLAAIASLVLAQMAPPAGQARSPAQEKPTAQDPGDLQKATQNPVAGLISVPIQNNTNLGIGSFDRNQNVLNIQPVIPISVNQNWNMIIRWIAPVIWQPLLARRIWNYSESKKTHAHSWQLKMCKHTSAREDWRQLTPPPCLSPSWPRRNL